MNFIKKATKPFAGGLPVEEGLFSVVLEPKAGHTPADIENEAREAAATDLEWLGENMLSASIDRAGAERLSKVAHVTPKRMKQPRVH